MILKNTWGKYDSKWTIGDIRLSRKPESFHIEGHTRKTGAYLYEGAEGLEKYMQSTLVSKFAKIIYSILDEHLKNGTESLSCLELAVQYCIRMGMFDEEYKKSRINAFIDEIKTMTEEKDAIRHFETVILRCTRLGMFDDDKKSRINAFIDEIKAMTKEKDGTPSLMLDIIGGDADNIPANGMAFIERRVYEDLVREYALPPYLLPDETGHAFKNFFHNLRITITHTLLSFHIFDFEELPTPSFHEGRNE